MDRVIYTKQISTDVVDVCVTYYFNEKQISRWLYGNTYSTNKMVYCRIYSMNFRPCHYFINLPFNIAMTEIM